MPLRIVVMGLLAALLATGCGEKEEPVRAPVTLALEFMPNAVHAGIYAAAEEGDLEIEVRAPSGSADSLKLLDSGRVDIAVADIHDLGLARERGADLVGVGALVQRPLAAVIATGEIERPRELEGRRVGVTGLPSDDAVLQSVVREDGGDPEKVRRVTIGFSAVPSLIAGRVAAATAFWNAEGVALRERGTRTREFRVEDFGAPSYPELVLVVTRRTLRERRELVESVLAELREGTERVLADPGAAVDRMVRVSRADRPLVEAQLAAVRPALSPPLRLDRDALEGWARFDARFGILERAPDVDEAFSFGLTG